MNTVKGIHIRGGSKEGTASAWGPEFRGRLHRGLSSGYLKRSKKHSLLFGWWRFFVVVRRHSFLCICFGWLGFVVIAERHFLNIQRKSWAF